MERLRIVGHFYVVLKDKNGNIKWKDDFPNTVTDAGALLLLDHFLGASAFTATCYLGLRGSGAVNVTDTQASHGGWLEIGNTNTPTYSGLRKTVSWSAASGTGTGSRSKSSSGSMIFTFTSNGTVDGAFLNINGSATVDNTTGTVFSAGTFNSGSKSVVNTDTLTV